MTPPSWHSWLLADTPKCPARCLSAMCRKPSGVGASDLHLIPAQRRRRGPKRAPKKQVKKRGKKRGPKKVPKKEVKKEVNKRSKKRGKKQR